MSKAAKPRPGRDAGSSYVELHCHSSFSFLDGASTPQQLAERAAKLGYPALALTDHDGIWGSMEFALACREHGVRPLTGAEVTVTVDGDGTGTPFHLTLLAESADGYANLCRLLTLGHAGTRNGRDRRADPPRLPLERLAEHADGLVCLSGCAGNGLIPATLTGGDPSGAVRLARRLRGWFGKDHFRIELQRPFWRYDRSRNRWLADLAHRLDVPAVATGNVHSHRPERNRLQDVLVAVRHRLDLAAAEPWRRGNTTSAMVSPGRMARRFAEHPEAVAETVRLADRLRFDLERELGYRYPRSGDPAADRDLSVTCQELLRQRYRDSARLDEARARLENELGIIRSHGLSGFFLLHRDLLELAREVAVEVRGRSAARAVLPPGRGRGSSVSSIVCYLTGLSHVDPVEAGLFPGRFLNEGITTMPDIDLDFPRDLRAALIPRIHARYGRDRSALIAAFPTWKMRGALREFSQVLGIPASEVESARRLLGPGGRSDSPLSDLEAAIGPQRATSPAWRHLAGLIEAARDLPRHPSQHSGGMVISTRPLTELCPVVPTAMPERQILMWDKDSCRDAGFLKIDLLGLGMLSAVERCVEEISRSRGELVDLSRIDLDDGPTFEMIRRGETTGVFQIESRAQMQILPRMQPRNLEDLAVQVALIRPGPIQGGAVHPYLERRVSRRQEPDFRIPYDHPLLEPALKETLGVIVFQEQVLEVAIEVAGFTASEAEGLRRAMSRKRSREALEAYHRRFVAGAVGRGLTATVAERVYARILAFSGFGFPKAHSVAFGLLAYQSAWLKVHYGPEYLSALLNEQPMGFYPPDSLVSEARRRGVSVLAPDVNRSRVECAVEWPDDANGARSGSGAAGARSPAVRIGLGYIKGAREEQLGQLVRERESGGPFRDLADLASRVAPGRRDLERLAWAGALRSLTDGGRLDGLWRAGLVPETPIQSSLPFAEADPPELPEPDGWQRVKAEYGTIGMTLEGHPLGLLREQLPAGTRPAAELHDLPPGARTGVAGLIVSRQRPPSANGVTFLLIEDETDTMNLVLSPGTASRFRAVIAGAVIVRATGRLETRNGTPGLVVHQLEEIVPPDPLVKALAPTGLNFGRRGR